MLDAGSWVIGYNGAMDSQFDYVVLLSAEAEWAPIQQFLNPPTLLETPFGEAFPHTMTVDGNPCDVLFMHGGWGKIAAASSTQYAIDLWNPSLIVNLGTCGGFAGDIERGTIIMADFTLVYDIVEQMGDPDEALAHFATPIDLSWITDHPIEVTQTMLISADRDIVVDEIDELRSHYGVQAADWESGAIAWVAARNGVRCLILRAVSDLVSPEGGEAYEDKNMFTISARPLMIRLLNSLPEWLAQAPVRQETEATIK